MTSSCSLVFKPMRRKSGVSTDEMDFQRATQAYIWAVPFVAMAEWKHAHLDEIGATENETVL